MTRDFNDLYRELGTDGARILFDAAALKSMNRRNGLNGHGHAEEHQPPPPEDAVPEGFTADGLEIAMPVPQLVKGILPQQGTALLIGQSQAGKTFITTDLAVATASGQAFFEKPIKRRGGVVIIAAEGMGGLQNRLIAAKLNRDLPKALPILWPMTIGNLLNELDMKAMLGKLTEADLYFKRKFGVPLVLTIVDTITKATSLVDENNNAEIVKVCKRVSDRIAAHTKALALAVHHMGKDQDAGPRGGSAWTGNHDIVLANLADRDTGKVSNRSLILSKNREGTEGAIGGFKLKFIELGTDEDGDPFGSCAIEPTGENDRPAPTRKEGHGAKAFHDAFNEIMLATGGTDRRPNGNGPKVKAVKLLDVRNDFYRRYATSEEDPAKAYDSRRAAWKRALKGMLETNRYFHETDRGVEWLWQ